MRFYALFTLLLIPSGAMAQIGLESNVFHASLPQNGVTIWTQTSRNMETGALVSGSLEARISGISVSKLEVVNSEGTTVFDFGTAIGQRHARLTIGFEDEASMVALALLMEDPTQFRAVAAGQEAIFERAETSVSVGTLPLTDISLPGSAAFRVLATAAVTAIRTPSGGALLITCSASSIDRQLFSPGVGLYASGQVDEGLALIHSSDFGFSMSGRESNVSSYTAVLGTDTSGRAAIDGLFSAPEAYSVGVDAERGRSPIAISLGATQATHFRTRLIPVTRADAENLTGEFLQSIFVHVATDLDGAPTAAHLTFQSHLPFPAARRHSESGLASNSGIYPYQCTTDLALSFFEELAPSSVLLGRCNLSDRGTITALLKRPEEFVSVLSTFSAAPVSGEASVRMHGLLERDE